MSAFDVPGMAVAVVQDGRTVLARGYGVRRMGGEVRVDAHTRFGIGSNTKGMTAALLAMLVDEGRVRWEDPVVDHLPDFTLADTAASRSVTLQDLLAHRSGLGMGAGDLLVFPASTLSSAEVVARIGRLPLAGRLRSGFRYNNMNYVAAGAVIEAATGLAWDEAVRQRLLEPIGMPDASTSAAEYDAMGNWAAPHRVIGGRLQPVDPAVFDNGAAQFPVASYSAALVLASVIPIGSRSR